jgi:hypothetical protein
MREFASLFRGGAVELGEDPDRGPNEPGQVIPGKAPASRAALECYFNLDRNPV